MAVNDMQRTIHTYAYYQWESNDVGELKDKPRSTMIEVVATHAKSMGMSAMPT
jgi:hypothetical protein